MHFKKHITREENTKVCPDFGISGLSNSTTSPKTFSFKAKIRFSQKLRHYSDKKNPKFQPNPSVGKKNLFRLLAVVADWIGVSSPSRVLKGSIPAARKIGSFSHYDGFFLNNRDN